MGLPQAFVGPELAIMPCLYQDTEGDTTADRHIPFQLRTRPCAIPKSYAAGGHERPEAGGEGGGWKGRAVRR